MLDVKSKKGLFVTYTEKKGDCGYHYYVMSGAFNYTAFKTVKSFGDWIKRFNLKLKFIGRGLLREDDSEFKEYAVCSEGNINECSFWSMEEIPNEAIKFIDLSNGNYVDCYYYNDGDDSFVFRPNPNSKDVYKPLSLDEYLEFSKLNG